MLYEVITGLGNFLDAALHVEVAFGHVVPLAIKDFSEAADGVLDRDEGAGHVGEDLGHVERLGEEAP